MPKDFGNLGTFAGLNDIQRAQILRLCKPKQTRQKFTAIDDQILLQEVGNERFPAWNEIAKKIPGKTGRQCRERYQHYLAPSISQEPWSEEEDALVISLFQIHGPNWAKIAESFMGKRTNNSIKNRWNNHLKLHLLRSIAPCTVVTEPVNVFRELSVPETQEPAVQHNETTITDSMEEEIIDDSPMDVDIWSSFDFPIDDDVITDGNYDFGE